MPLKTISWVNGAVRIIDQTKLPGKFEYLDIRDLRVLFKAIKELKVRGAPALAAAAALGVCLGIKDFKAKNINDLKQRLDKVIVYIGSSRPTAKNLFWGLERMRRAFEANSNKSPAAIKNILFQEAKKIIREDGIACRRIGYFGAKLLKNKDTVLTVCNAGILATIDYGTALGVIYRAKEGGKDIKVFACETRPLLQGARLTAWELKKNRLDVSVICDNTAASLMAGGKVKKVIAGADRIAANGDSANKIGTLGLAILCRYHKIPFYIAAPGSTFDLKIKNGSAIPIEQRDAKEVKQLFFKNSIIAKGIKVYNPAFDVTPHELITAIITDKGIIKPPYKQNTKKMIGK